MFLHLPLHATQNKNKWSDRLHYLKIRQFSLNQCSYRLRKPSEKSVFSAAFHSLQHQLAKLEETMKTSQLWTTAHFKLIYMLVFSIIHQKKNKWHNLYLDPAFPIKTLHLTRLHSADSVVALRTVG